MDVTFEDTATTPSGGVTTATLGRAFDEVPTSGEGAAGGGGSPAGPRCPRAHEKPSVRHAGVRNGLLG